MTISEAMNYLTDEQRRELMIAFNNQDSCIIETEHPDTGSLVFVACNMNITKGVTDSSQYWCCGLKSVHLQGNS